MTNSYVALVSNPYGFSGAAPNNLANVPSKWAASNGLTPEELTQKLAYEWLNSYEITGADSNPPFTSGAAGRLIPGLNGGQRIVRGYIRRANYEAGDFVSKARLNFMYNPENIVRDYVSYLDQAALDPFNTVYGSSNLVAPPSFMNFRFDLFFDRQDEVSQDINNPGVFADYQFFDLVVRNVVPTDPNQVNTSLPDNGVMMVNPRDITVVFSPQLTVQGRPINAQVVFEKFSHKMTPTRMRIALEMRVVYIGPMRSFTEYTMDTATQTTQDTVAADDSSTFVFNNDDALIADGATNGASAFTGAANSSVQTGLNNVTGISNPANATVRQQAMQKAFALVSPTTIYDAVGAKTTPGPDGKLRYATCSSLVWHAYDQIGMTDKMAWGGSKSWTSDTRTMIASLPKNRMTRVFTWDDSGRSQAATYFSDATNRAKIQPGDLLYRDAEMQHTQVGHVAFFVGWSADGSSFQMFDAASKSSSPQVGLRTKPRQYLIDHFNHVMRPVPLGATSYTQSTTNNPHVGQYGNV